MTNVALSPIENAALIAARVELMKLAEKKDGHLEHVIGIYKRLRSEVGVE